MGSRPLFPYEEMKNTKEAAQDEGKLGGFVCHSDIIIIIKKYIIPISIMINSIICNILLLPLVLLLLLLSVNKRTMIMMII